MRFTPIASGSAGNAYLVDDGDTRVLLDAGIPLNQIQRACGYTVSSLSACLITHCHKDHCKAVNGLLSMGVDVFMSAGTLKALTLYSRHRAHVLAPLISLTIGTFEITALDVQHDAPEPFGYVLESTMTGEKLLYFTDTYYVKYRFDGLTHIAAECNYDADSVRAQVEAGDMPIERLPRLLKSHMSLEHLLEMLKANDLSKVRQIYLLHMSDKNSNADYMREAVQRATGAEVYVC
jgi:phosphoribosyl 1,2-cyclic phosphodiesterase